MSSGALSPLLIEAPGAMRERTVNFDGADWVRLPSGIMVPPELAPVEPIYPLGIDLFCGAGGFSCGFMQAGWHVIAATDWDEWCCLTYLANLGSPDTRIICVDDADETRLRKVFKTQKRIEAKGGLPAEGELLEHPEGGLSWTGAGHGWIGGDHTARLDADGQPDTACWEPCEVYFLGDARKLTGDIILGELGLERGEVDGVFGGPPCQGFSISGKRDVMDPRNGLVFEFARLVCEMQPKTMIFENVPGIVSMKTVEGLYVADALARILADGGMGTYEALRRSLGSDPKARGVIRGAKVPHREKTDPEPSKPTKKVREPEQLALTG